MATSQRLTEQVSFRMNQTMLARLHAAAAFDERTVADEARRLLCKALNEMVGVPRIKA